MVRPEFVQTRAVYNLPEGHEIKGGWVRIRNEGDKITLSLKVVDGQNIDDQKEVYLEVSDFTQADLLLTSLGCRKKAYQETKRELWKLDSVEITIDEWPFLEPFVEVEGPSEESVRSVSHRIGFDYEQAQFCAVDTLYQQKYNIPTDLINNHTPEIIFSGPNPFINHQQRQQ